MPSPQKINNAVFAALFVGVCLLPGLALLLPGLDRGGDLNEKRELAAFPAPDTEVTEIPDAFEAWFNDHFGYRSLLVRLQGLFRYRVFNASSERQVLPGRDGWLFYDGRGGRGGDPRANYLAQLPADHERIFRELKEQFLHNDRYFAARGITYLIVFVPDKWSIYSELLPASLGAAADRTSADQFVDYLRAETDLKILDLKEPLREKRWQDGPLYYRNDTHWNELGAWHAAAEIAEFAARFEPGVGLLTGAPRPRWQTKTDGDLAELLGLAGWLREEVPILDPVGLPSIETEDLPPTAYNATLRRFAIHTRSTNSALPRAVIMRDSFGNALLPWLSPSFSEARWIWTSNVRRFGFDPLLDELQPQIVIEQKVEKLMMFPIRYFTAPGRPAVQSQSGRKKR